MGKKNVFLNLVVKQCFGNLKTKSANPSSPPADFLNLLNDINTMFNVKEKTNMPIFSLATSKK